MDNIYKRKSFFWSAAGGIMEEACLIGLKETKGTGKLTFLLENFSIYDFSQAQQQEVAFFDWFRILVWEDGYCDFYECEREGSGYVKGRFGADIFFKMSHEVYNFGEG